jgi:hypothetical protein
VQTLGHRRESLTYSQSAWPDSSSSFEIAARITTPYAVSVDGNVLGGQEVGNDTEQAQPTAAVVLTNRLWLTAARGWDKTGDCPARDPYPPVTSVGFPAGYNCGSLKLKSWREW